MKHICLFLLLLTISSAFLAGCGSSTPKPEVSTAPQATPAPTTTAATPPAQSASTQSSPTTTSPPPRSVTPTPDHLQEVTRLIAAQKFAEAEKDLDRIITENPKDPHARYLRGGVLTNGGRIQAALADFNSAIESAPQNADYLHTRALLYLGIKQNSLAAEDFQKVLTLNPHYPQARNNLGLIFMSQGDYDRAVREFDINLKDDPKRIDVLNNRGMAHWRAGHYDKALADFNAALELNPKNVSTLTNRGQLHYYRANLDLAISDFTAATVHDPYNINHYQNRQMAYLKMGRLIDAEDNGKHIVWLRNLFTLQRNHEQHPESQKLRVQLARHFIEGKELEKATLLLDDVLKNEPKNVEALLARAELWAQKREWAKVAADCTTALFHEDSFDARSLRGDAYFQLRKLDEAIADYEVSQRFDAQVADAYYQRSRQRQSAGNAAGAKADLEHARDLNPKLSTADAAD